jgi:hypothetical protein
MRLPDEDRVRITDSCVKPHAQLVSEKRTGRDATEMSEIRVYEGAIDGSPLLIALPIRKEEDAVVTNRAAQGKAELPALKERIGIRGITGESGIS